MKDEHIEIWFLAILKKYDIPFTRAIVRKSVNDAHEIWCKAIVELLVRIEGDFHGPNPDPSDYPEKHKVNEFVKTKTVPTFDESDDFTFFQDRLIFRWL